MAAGAVLETLEQQVLRLQLVEPVVELQTKVRKDSQLPRMPLLGPCPG